MHNPPPSVYENWPAPNYVDPVTRGSALTIVNSTVAAVAIIVVLARCYTRLRITGSFGLDDVLICVALLPSLGLTGCTLASERIYGWNRHIWDATEEQIRGGLKLEFASGILYIQSSLITKLSVVFFCRRLLSDSHPAWYRHGLHVYAVLTFIGNMAYTITFCLSCQPLYAYWDYLPPTWEPDYPYHCIDIGMLWLSGSILNATWDLLTWLIPLPIVLQLHLPMKQRIAVMALFALGLAVVIAGVLKTVYVQLSFNESYDVTWTGYPDWICGALEIDVGILCASIPALRPLFSHFFSRPGDNRWVMRRSYNRMSKGRDSLGEGTPLSPLSPMSPAHLKVETSFNTDHLKPWSKSRSARNSMQKVESRSARSSMQKFEASPISPISSVLTPPTTTRNSKTLSPVTEIMPAEEELSTSQGAASLLSANDEAMQEHFEAGSDQSWSRPMSWASGGGKTKVLGAVAKPTTTDVAAAVADQKNHSRKTSAPSEFENFNFGMPATSSRRTSQGTAPPSYGEFVSHNSFIISEEAQQQRQGEQPRPPPPNASSNGNDAPGQAQ